MSKTLYEILGVKESASDEELREALNTIERRLGVSNDPAAEEQLKIAREAYAILTTHKPMGLSIHAVPESKPLAAWPKFFQQPALYGCLIAIAGLLVYRDIEIHKIQSVEAQRIANEKSIAEAQRIANEKSLAEAQERNWQLALKEAELAEKELELKNKQAEFSNRSSELMSGILARQLERENERANQALEIERSYARPYGSLENSQARRINADSRWEDLRYNRTLEAESYNIKAQSDLLHRYQQQRRDGEDHITTSNPGLDRW